ERAAAVVTDIPCPVIAERSTSAGAARYCAAAAARFDAVHNWLWRRSRRRADAELPSANDQSASSDGWRADTVAIECGIKQRDARGVYGTVGRVHAYVARDVARDVPANRQWP